MTAKKRKEPMRLVNATTGKFNEGVQDRIMAVVESLKLGEFLTANEICQMAKCSINSVTIYCQKQPLVDMRIQSGRAWLYVNRETMAAYRAEQKGSTE